MKLLSIFSSTSSPKHLGLPFCGPEKGEHISESSQNFCGPEAPEQFSSLLPPLLGEEYRLSDGTNK